MSEELTVEEKAINYETMLHIRELSKAINVMVFNLLDRASKHDQSKLESPEVEVFTEYTPRLKNLDYGSPEYIQTLKEMDPTLQHHYARSTHHPEHYKDGINDMNLLDIVEMFADWWAASKRHANGNLRKSIEINGKRFDMSPQLVRIFENTVSVLEGK
jgi:hypothetical protein